MIKRLFDVFLSFLCLLIFSPILFAIALFIKIEDGSPVFYRGIRVGKNGKLFRMWKFRTMVIDADKIGGPSTADDDPRITKVGKIIRRYKLDEFPQLFNVLIGQMSFVGPRPEVTFYIDMLKDEEKDILKVKPGITDWASLWNSNEGAVLAGSNDPEKIYMEKIRPKKIKLQLKYVKERSFLQDIIILYLTIKMLFKKEKVEL